MIEKYLNTDKSFVDNFNLITEIGCELSNMFDGLITDDIRKQKATHYLAKAINTNFSILRLLDIDSNKSFSFVDSSSIYSLLRNQLEICNIYWYLLCENYEGEYFKLKLDLLEYHDSIACQIIYNPLLPTEENKHYFKEKEKQYRLNIESNTKFLELNNDVKKQIIKGNKSTLLTQFEIVERRKFNLEVFKAYYKLFSTHTHSSPTSIKNIVTNKISEDSDFIEFIFLDMSLGYINSFISNLILSVGEIWNIDFRNLDSEKMLKFYANQL